MNNNRNTKRFVVLAVIALIIALGYWLGPMVFALFLEMHGL